MTRFEAPTDAVDRRCTATVDQIRCELDSHPGSLHRNGPLLWHEPPLILVGGAEPDLESPSARWRDGRVLLFDDAEPDL